MSHTVREKSRLLARVRRIRGQLEALEHAIEDEKSCAEVLHQIAGARGAIQGLMAKVAEQHVREHIAGSGESSVEARQQAADEYIDVLRTYLK